MKIFAWSLCVVALLAGCATGSTSAVTSSPASTHTGEVWTWDEQLNTITLNQNGRIFRVKVTPDQFVGLQLHRISTIRGEIAGPAELPVVMLPTGVVTPKGSAEDVEARGTISTIDPSGTVTITTDRGPMQVWVATPGTSFKSGDNVRVKVRVQPMEVRPAIGSPPVPVPAAAAMPEPAASIPSDPGDYAVVRGQVLATDPSGRITVSSPRGPIQIMVAGANRYRLADVVEVRTSVHPAP